MPNLSKHFLEEESCSIARQEGFAAICASPYLLSPMLIAVGSGFKIVHGCKIYPNTGGSAFQSDSTVVNQKGE
jgi:hypothetical protein